MAKQINPIENRLSDEQQNIFNQIISDVKNSIEYNQKIILSLSGAAGTGKTYLLSRIIQYMAQNHRVIATAPTHKALSVIETNLANLKHNNVTFSTIHSFLGVRLVRDFLTGEEAYRVDEHAFVKKVDFLIVDESSMINSKLFFYIQEALRKDQTKAVLFVGDPFQLLPIDNDKSIVFDSVSKHFYLTEIIRQKGDSYIIDVAVQIKEIIEHKQKILLENFFYTNRDIGIDYFYDMESFYGDFCKNENWDNENKIIACFTNKSVSRHNNILRCRFWQEKANLDVCATDFHIGDKVIFQESYMTKKDSILLNNQKVELAYAKKVFFHELGIHIWICKDKEQNDIYIVDSADRQRHQQFLDNIVNNIRNSRNVNTKIMWKNFFQFKYSFAQVKYQFASTIHKLQGSTLDTIYIDLTDITKNKNLDMEQMFRLLYVAVTRASKNVKVLLPISEEDSIGYIQNCFYNLSPILSL